EALKKDADARKLYAAGSYLPAGAMFLEAAQGMLPSEKHARIAHTTYASNVELTCRNAGLAYLMGEQEAQLKQEAAKATWPCQQGLEHSLTLASPVELTYLANEGVLVQAFGRAIVIDGLHRFYGPEYAVLPAPEREQLEQAQADYGKVDVVIASHRHGDHFSAEATAMHLQANPQAVFYGPPQTVKLLLALAGANEVAGRVHAIDATPGASTTVTVPGKPATELEFLGLRHVGKRHTAVENLGVLVTLDGVKVLHVGDAVGDAANLAGFGLAGRKLDAALIPFWYLDTPSSRRVVAEQIAARQVFAFHIDPRDGVGVHAEPEVWSKRWPGGVPMVDTLRVWPIFRATTSN
ncbi:MAG: MBL fold metallo-hydrolase, partial [Nannocystaceae bacterium]